MVGQTIRLFIKALIIGILVNMGLQQVSAVSLPATDNQSLPRQVIFSNSSASPDSNLPNQAGN